MRFVDKLIEHPEFTGVVSLIRHIAFVVGAESMRNALVSAGHSGHIDAPFFGPVTSVNEAFLAFASMDHASLLGLGDLDMQGVRGLYAFCGSDCTPEDMASGDDEVGHGDNIVVGDGDTVIKGGGGASGHVDVNAGLGGNDDGNHIVVIDGQVCVDKIVVENVVGVEGFIGDVGGKLVLRMMTMRIVVVVI